MSGVLVRVLIVMAMFSGAAFAQSFQRIPELTGFINTHAISGDGTKIAFVSPRDPVGTNSDGNLEVFVFDRTTNRVHQITRTASQANFFDHNYVQISHDGRRLAFKSRFALHTTGLARLSDEDVFIADINYATTPIGVAFRRITTTSERGAIALSGDGTTLLMVSDGNHAARNADRKVQLFRVNLDPAASFFQLTDAPDGIADSVFDPSISVSHNARVYLFTSNRDLRDGGNPDGNPEVFRLTELQLTQITHTPAPVVNKTPRIAPYTFNYITWVSNGDPTGNNADGNFEVFFYNGTATLQVTRTNGGDTGFGGANDRVDINNDGKVLVFTSTRDLVPPGNADFNREIFSARLDPTNLAAAPVFAQITNTTNASPGSRFENNYPRISALSAVMAFNSDLNLGVPGTSVLYAATLATTPTTLPPVISSFNPAAAGPGVVVAIGGQNFAPTTAVRFGALDAAGFNVITDGAIEAVVPAGFAAAPITVVTPHGSATWGNLALAQFVNFGVEFNQGVPDYPPVAGKDALVRVFAAAQGPAGVNPVHWKITQATLTLTAPSGQVSTVTPTLHDPVIANTAQDFSERRNINFYIPGQLLAEAGRHTFEVRTLTEGQSIFQQVFTRDLTATKDIVAVFQTLLRDPEPEEWRTILRAFDVMSRIYPVRAGIGDLRGAIGASDFEAGLRIAYVAAPLFAEQAGSPQILCPGGCISAISEEINARLTAVNSGGFEATELSLAFNAPGTLVSDTGVVASTCDQYFDLLLGEFGAAFRGIELGASGALVSLCDAAGGVLSHEVGHVFGLVPPGAPNNNGSGHSTTFPPDNPFPTRAFNVPLRRHVEQPFSIMDGFIGEDNAFLESQTANGQPLDYPFLVTQRRLTTSGLPALPMVAATANAPLAVAPTPLRPVPRIAIVGSIDPKEGRARIYHSYRLPLGTQVTPLDRKSTYLLRFVDAAGKTLAEEPATVRAAVADNERHRRKVAETLSLAVVRPLPAGTRRIEIKDRRSGGLLGGLAAGVNRPSLHINRVSTTRDHVMLTWRGADRDGDALSYHVEYSRDGAQFSPVLGATRNTALSIPLKRLPGSTRGVFRVTASDGINTASAVSARFQVPEHAPVAAVLAPRHGVSVQSGDPLWLRALAYDMEDGVLGAVKGKKARFEWFLGQKKLGVGPQLSLREPLASGFHYLRLVVTDSSGRTGEDKVGIRVLGKPATVVPQLPARR